MSKTECHDNSAAIAFAGQADAGVSQHNASKQNLRGRVVRTQRPPPVLVCRKCLKRADNGKAIKRALKDDLKARAKAGAPANGEKKTKRAKLVLTSCFGICPKGAVVAASGAMLAQGEVLLLRDKNEIAAVAARLRGSRSG